MSFFSLLRAFPPVVPERICEHGSVLEVVAGGDGPGGGFRTFKFTFSVLVPKIVATVLAVGGERVELLIE